MNVSFINILRSHYRLKFPFYPELANQYLQKLLLPAVKTNSGGGESIAHLLERIIRDNIEENEPSKIIIPLSSGFDSRGVLGAALNIFPKEKILCVTYGSKRDYDVIGARKVCKKIRLDWTHIDIDSNDVSWDIDQIVHLLKCCYAQTGSFGAVKNIVMQAEINKIACKGSVILSGYLGDAVSGSHLKQNISNDPSKAVEHFIKWNDSNINLLEYDFEIKYLTQFLEKWISRLDQFDSSIKVTPTDILDLGFRQGIRIKSITGGFQDIHSPYEDSRWISHWYHLPINKRINQSYYQSELINAYPLVFSLTNKNAFNKRVINKINYSILKKPKWLLPKNDSMNYVYRELISSLDKRDLFSGFKFEPFLNMLFSNPNNRKMFNAIDTAASIEGHIQAGNYK